MRAASAAPASPIRTAEARSSITVRIAARQRLGRRIGDEAVDAVATSSVGTAAVAAGDHRLARRERFDGDEAVVFVERQEATARQRAR